MSYDIERKLIWEKTTPALEGDEDICPESTTRVYLDEHGGAAICRSDGARGGATIYLDKEALAAIFGAQLASGIRDAIVDLMIEELCKRLKQ